MKISFSQDTSSNQVDLGRSGVIECLKAFSPFDSLSKEDLILLSTRSRIEDISKGHRLFDIGDEDPWIFCLLEGSLRLVAGDGRAHQIQAGTPQGKRPVAQLKPRKYCAVATTPGRCVRIDGTGFGEFGTGIKVRDYFVTEIMEDPAVDPSNGHFQRLLEDDFELPSLPEVAMETCRVMDDKNCDIAMLAKVVSRDIAIAAKLVKAANSPIYYGKESIETCERALFRLGMNATRQLVLTFSARELFKAKSGPLKKRMQLLWEHSTEVAAICRVLAKRIGGFDPEQAQLAGLLHDIGAVPIVSYAQSQPDLSKDPEVLDGLIDVLRKEIGGRMLKSWNFPAPLIAVVTQAEDWWRDSEPSPDLVDLVVVGQLLSFIGKSSLPDVPNISRLPAFEKISRGRLDPASVLALLDETDEEIAEARALLQG